MPSERTGREARASPKRGVTIRRRKTRPKRGETPDGRILGKTPALCTAANDPPEFLHVDPRPDQPRLDRAGNLPSLWNEGEVVIVQVENVNGGR